MHSANEVVAELKEVDVQVVVPNTAVDNTSIQISESPEAHRTTIDVSRQEDGTLQPDTADPLLDISQVEAEQVVSLTTQGITSDPTI